MKTISILTFISLLCFFSLFAQDQSSQISVQGTLLEKDGSLVIITDQGKGYRIIPGEKKDLFAELKTIVESPNQLLIYGKDTGESTIIRNYEYDDKGVISRILKESYKVINLISFKQSGVPSTETDKLMDVFLKIEKPEDLKKETLTRPAARTSTPASPFPESPAIPVLAEIEGKVLEIDLKALPMPILKIALKEGGDKDTITLFAPMGVAVIRGSEQASIQDIKTGMEISIWYKEFADKRTADIISILE